MKDTNWLMPLGHKNNFHFNPSPRDFTVEEIPLYTFSGEGEHTILRVTKKGVSTWEFIDMLSTKNGIPRREIGYAGLKDKNALTIQYISIPSKYEDRVLDTPFDNCRVTKHSRHNNKLRIGHLKGNRFWLRFKKVLPLQKEMIESVLDYIEKEGMPNYFGNQRFGNSMDNWQKGKLISEGKLRLKDRRMRTFLLSAWQSYLFNSWLSKRVQMCRLLQSFKYSEVESILNLPKDTLQTTQKQKQFFKILEGDILMHYPYGKIFYAKEMDKEVDRFIQKDISITGLIAGKKVKRAKEMAKVIEDMFDTKINEQGSRRYGWIFLQDIDKKYIKEKAQYELSFYLPKGSYATVVVDMLRGEYGSCAI